jgi:ABC-type transport system involved in cytochrome c biogenesis ATPase subunit
VAASRSRPVPMNFAQMSQSDVPQGRNGKHKSIVTRILTDLAQVEPGNAIKVPLADLKESKEKVRSAVNRASRKAGLSLMTASDEDFLYLWNEPTNQAKKASSKGR